MQAPSHLAALNLQSTPLDYEWDMVIANGIWAANDADNPRLSDAIDLIGVKAAFGLGLACCEWVAARVADHVDTRDAWQRIEAGWAAVVDSHYAHMPLPPDTADDDEEDWAWPLVWATMGLAYSHKSLLAWDGLNVRRGTYMLARLAEHLSGRHPTFRSWLPDALRRCHTHFPPGTTPCSAERPVPREFFDPAFVWQDDAPEVLTSRFIQAQDPAANPYLQSAAETTPPGTGGTPRAGL